MTKIEQLEQELKELKEKEQLKRDIKIINDCLYKLNHMNPRHVVIQGIGDNEYQFTSNEVSTDIMPPNILEKFRELIYDWKEQLKKESKK